MLKKILYTSGQKRDARVTTIEQKTGSKARARLPGLQLLSGTVIS